MGDRDRHDDETERRRLQKYIFELEEIQEEAEQLSVEHEKVKYSRELLVAHAPVGFVCVDTAGKILEINSRLLDILGLDSIEDAEAIVSADRVIAFDPDLCEPVALAGWLPPTRPLSIGVLAGASSPEVVVGRVIDRLAEFLQ